jgi:hypothetical protein
LKNGPEKTELVNTIANHMKKSYLTWNRDSVNDATIADNLAELSKGRTGYAEEAKFIPNLDLQRNVPVKKKKFTPRKDNQRYQRKPLIHTLLLGPHKKGTFEASLN